MELVLVAEDEAGALQETRGDLLFTISVEHKESPYLAWGATRRGEKGE